MAVSQGPVGFLADMFADIRHKLVEEGWFGRRVTPISRETSSEMDQNLGWVQWKDAQVPTPGQAHDYGIGH